MRNTYIDHNPKDVTFQCEFLTAVEWVSLLETSSLSSSSESSTSLQVAVNPAVTWRGPGGACHGASNSQVEDWSRMARCVTSAIRGAPNQLPPPPPSMFHESYVTSFHNSPWNPHGLSFISCWEGACKGSGPCLRQHVFLFLQRSGVIWFYALQGLLVMQHLYINMKWQPEIAWFFRKQRVEA